MLKKSLKITVKLFLLILAIESLHFSVLASPQKIFTHHISFGRYEVYSDSAITPSLLTGIIDADKRIQSSELYTNSFTANIFICSDPDLYAGFLFLIGKYPASVGVNLSIFNNTFINLKRINLLRQYRDERISYSHLTRETSQTIAHELTHNLVGNYLGFFKTRTLPSWKSEGYSEYISTIHNIHQDTSYSFMNRCNVYYKYNVYYAAPHSIFYYKSQLLTEFLFEQQKYDFDHFIREEINESGSEKMLLSWFEKLKKTK